ncbi:MAG: S8 family serine peptidase [Bacteroidales bacterium]|nr:S8 family serine peptidase [Bacteroidales bacterium]
MKNKLLFLLLLSAALAHAQDEFYYYHGNQIPLFSISNRVVCLTDPNTDTSFLNGLTPVETIADTACSIKVLEIPSAMSRSQLGTIAQRNGVNANLQNCFLTEANDTLCPTGYINVKLNASSDYPLLRTFAIRYDCAVAGHNRFMPLWYTIRVQEETTLGSVEIANALYETGLFAAVTPCFWFDPLEISYDPNVYDQWNLYNPTYEGIDISASKAWDYATGHGVKIAVIDQGVELTHADLAANIYPLSYDAYTDSSPSGLYGDHGTHCAGIAAAVRNNNVQIAGVAPDAQIMSVSALNGPTSNGMLVMSDAINWAWKNGADILSCSWSCRNRNELIENAIDSAVCRGRQGKGCIFVKSAGNTGDSITFPGGYSEDVIAVGNLTSAGIINDGSCHGPNLLVCAPGTDILSTVLNDAIDYNTGTSMACPHVSGVAALILERNPNLTAQQVRAIMASNAKKVGPLSYDTVKAYGTWNEYYGYGLIDAYQSIINTPRN